MSFSAQGISVTVDTTPLITNVSIDAHAGEVLGIIGPNGSGKSTLLRALAGLLPPSSGDITLEGIPLSGFNARERAIRLAYVAQDTRVGADLTVDDLILLGRYAHRRRFARLTGADLWAADEAAQTVGITAYRDRSVQSLSGGERQLANIARALTQQANIMLLDEPTSALDVYHQLRILTLLRAQAAAGSTVIVVLHDLNDAARYCDRLAVMHHGTLRTVGPPHEVLTPELLGEVYRIDARVHTDEFGYPHVHPLGVRATPESQCSPARERQP